MSRMLGGRVQGFQAQRTATLAISKVFLVAVAQIPFVHGAPLFAASMLHVQEEGKDPEDAALWVYLAVAAALVLLGGAFAGLTIALMGQDEMYLQVIKTSGEGAERKHAAKVLGLLNKGKHWVLVTLLLSNVITNETLPIVLDRSLGGGWPAVLGSTVLIVIFGEIAPQSVCVRFGLPIGSFMAPFVLALMYLMAPIAWPTAKLLDYLLGEEHGTVYKKAGLKTLVSLHKSMGEAGEQLNTDEVTIISAVLDLKDKTVGSIMTPMDDVFTLSIDDILDEDTVDMILAQGYSRIPIHDAENDNNFVGMLLVKLLITYDPEDSKPVRDFALATLPETLPETSCLDIVNFFQEGKSHMVLVSDNPGGDSGAIGVVTLEDVIEELIGEEIIDESDVFVDVHKAIRRITPAPRTRIAKDRNQVPKGKVLMDVADNMAQGQEDQLRDPSEGPPTLSRTRTSDAVPSRVKRPGQDAGSPRAATFLLRRRSSTANSDKGDSHASQMRIKANTPEMREHLARLGPSNLASKPRVTRYQNVKIKPGLGSESKAVSPGASTRRPSETMSSDYHGGIGEGLLNSAGMDAKDGVQAVHAGYGTMSSSPNAHRSGDEADKSVQTADGNLPTIKEPEPEDAPDEDRKTRRDTAPHLGSSKNEERSQDTVRSLKARQADKSPGYVSRGPARSGSITENIVDVNGVRKVVLEFSSESNESNEDDTAAMKSSTELKPDSGEQSREGSSNGTSVADGNEAQAQPSTSKNKKKKKKKKKNANKKPEEEPLLNSRDD